MRHRELTPSVQHRRSKYLNRAEKLSPAVRQRAPAGDETLHVDPARATIPVRVQRHLAALSAPSAPAVGGRLPTGDGRPLRRSGTRSPGRRTRPPPESATGTGRFVKATAHHPNHHIGQLGWLKLTMPSRGSGLSLPSTCDRIDALRAHSPRQSTAAARAVGWMAGQLREVALDVAVGDAQPALVGLAEQAGSNQLGGFDLAHGVDARPSGRRRTAFRPLSVRSTISARHHRSTRPTR